jgi:PBP1b-binding outer membrane lipoprotein LpoB
MMMGMGAAHGLTRVSGTGFSTRIKGINTGDETDAMIREMIDDLLRKNLPVSTIAVWQIRSRTAGIDVEIIRQKMISYLVESNRFQVIARDRLDQLLEEQNLALSGILDQNSAVEIGKLTGVEGFLDGYVSMNKDKLILSLNLIETRTGKIIWAKTLER